MNFNSYRDLAGRTEAAPSGTINPLAAHAVVSMAYLLGNMADVLKRTLAYGKPFDGQRFGAMSVGLINAAVFMADATDALEAGDPDAVIKEMAQATPEVQEKLLAVKTENIDPRLLHAVLGMISEIGELGEIAVKGLAGVGVDAVHVGEELGDLRWYDALACRALGLDSEAISVTNIEKLKARFPEKFTEDAVTNRDLASERSVLEEGIRPEQATEAGQPEALAA